jgi:hypothetical protein
MIAIPASLRSDFIHIAGTGIHIALEPTIHITGIGMRLHDPAGGTGCTGVYSTETPLDQLEENLHAHPSIENLDHLFDAESGLLTCHGKFINGLCC